MRLEEGCFYKLTDTEQLVECKRSPDGNELQLFGTNGELVKAVPLNEEIFNAVQIPMNDWKAQTEQPTAPVTLTQSDVETVTASELQDSPSEDSHESDKHRRKPRRNEE